MCMSRKVTMNLAAERSEAFNRVQEENADLRNEVFPCFCSPSKGIATVQPFLQKKEAVSSIQFFR